MITDKALALLAALGNTPEAVAAALAEAGVTGVRDRSTRCPIANFLYERLAGDGVRQVAVEMFAVTLTLASGGYADVILPKPVSWFVARFDEGWFLNLVAAPAEGGGTR